MCESACEEEGDPSSVTSTRLSWNQHEREMEREKLTTSCSIQNDDAAIRRRSGTFDSVAGRWNLAITDGTITSFHLPHGEPPVRDTPLPQFSPTRRNLSMAGKDVKSLPCSSHSARHKMKRAQQLRAIPVTLDHLLIL
jgi:hypothetical protein